MVMAMTHKSESGRMSNIELKAHILVILYRLQQESKPLQSIHSVMARVEGKSLSHVRVKKIINECIKEGTISKEFAGATTVYKLTEKASYRISEVINAFQVLGKPINIKLTFNDSD